MGKSKKRIFNKNLKNSASVLKREDIIKMIISDIKEASLKEETKNLISLFGITAEELTEAGISYEEISAYNTYLF